MEPREIKYLGEAQSSTEISALVDTYFKDILRDFAGSGRDHQLEVLCERFGRDSTIELTKLAEELRGSDLLYAYNIGLKLGSLPPNETLLADTARLTQAYLDGSLRTSLILPVDELIKLWDVCLKRGALLENDTKPEYWEGIRLFLNNERWPFNILDNLPSFVHLLHHSFARLPDEHQSELIASLNNAYTIVENKDGLSKEWQIKLAPFAQGCRVLATLLERGHIPVFSEEILKKLGWDLDYNYR